MQIAFLFCTCVLFSSSAPLPFPTDTVGCARLHVTPKKIPFHIYHHPVPFSDIQLWGSQAIFETFSVVTREFRKHHDLQHQSVLSILNVWSIFVVYQTRCHCPVGFFNRSEKSDTAFRNQSQRIIHLYATRKKCIAERLHDLTEILGIVRFRICPSFIQRLRWRNPCGFGSWYFASIERTRLVQVSQVLEQLDIKRFLRVRSSVATSLICDFNESTPLNTRWQHEDTFFLTRKWDDLTQSLSRSKCSVCGQVEETEVCVCMVNILSAVQTDSCERLCSRTQCFVKRSAILFSCPLPSMDAFLVSTVASSSIVFRFAWFNLILHAVKCLVPSRTMWTATVQFDTFRVSLEVRCTSNHEDVIRRIE